METLADHIKFDHGYTAKSPPIINLLEIMGEFTPEQQRAFCQFVTGAPRLPPGGLAVLNPKLTIVRKHPSSVGNTTSNAAGVSESADDDLPSVMTCANYLKLPPYSTKDEIIPHLDRGCLPSTVDPDAVYPPDKGKKVPHLPVKISTWKLAQLDPSVAAKDGARARASSSVLHPISSKHQKYD